MKKHELANQRVWGLRRSGDIRNRPGAEFRDPFGRDRARIIHSAGFRRLQAKTQVLGIGEGDFHRTRLTHSMEAAQIARGIVRNVEVKFKRQNWLAGWLPTLNMIEAAALGHDLGHPPFGHGGEVALNFAMRKHGGFEGNGQTLRLLARLESHTDGFGLDLTRRSFLAILKYPVSYETVARTSLPPDQDRIEVKARDWKPPKCYMKEETEVVDWILSPFTPGDMERFVLLASSPSADKHGKSRYHSLDTSIMELADDVAYGVHDFEDAIAPKLVKKDDWLQLKQFLDRSWADPLDINMRRDFTEQLFGGSSGARKRAIGALVNSFVVSTRPTRLSEFEHPLLGRQIELEEPARTLLDGLKALVVDRVIKTPQVQTLEYRGQQIVMALFEALASDPQRLLKESFRALYEQASTDREKMRVVCDYIAGMTDEYATRMYERLFVPRHGHVFDRF